MKLKPQIIKRLQIGGIIIALALVGIAIYQTVSKTSFLAPNKDVAKDSPQSVSVKSSAPNGPLPLLPADFPFDTSGKIAQNYTASSPGVGAVQYTRTYTTKKTAPIIFQSYLSYFKSNGWTILVQQQTTQVSNVFAYLDRVGVSITIQQLKDARFVSVTVGESTKPFLTKDQIKASQPPPASPQTSK